MERREWWGQSPAGHPWCQQHCPLPVMQEESDPPTWDLLQLQHSRQLPHPSLLGPAAEMQSWVPRDEFLWLFIVLPSCIVSRRCFDAPPKAPLRGHGLLLLPCSGAFPCTPAAPQLKAASERPPSTERSPRDAWQKECATLGLLQRLGSPLSSWAEPTGESCPGSCPQARLGSVGQCLQSPAGVAGSPPSPPHSLLLFCNWLQRIRHQ